MEGIAQNGKGDLVFLHQFQQLPEVGMENGVASGEIKIGESVIYLAKIQTIVEGILHLLPTHGIQGLAVVFGKNIAVFAPLVTLVSDVPLKGKIIHVVLLHRVGFFTLQKPLLGPWTLEGATPAGARVAGPCLLLVCSAAGSGSFNGLVRCAASSTAGCGLFLGCSSATGGRSFHRLVGRTASGATSGGCRGLLLLGPAKQLIQCHDVSLHGCIQGALALCNSYYIQENRKFKYALFYNIVTLR
jgi:hypothetical protein